jgi:hypothetical protein
MLQDLPRAERHRCRTFTLLKTGTDSVLYVSLHFTFHQNAQEKFQKAEGGVCGIISMSLFIFIQPVDPLVKVELHDVKRSKGKEEYTNTSHLTSVIDDNGLSPVWNDKGKEFQVENPAVAMFQFSLLDKDLVGDDKVACAAIPVSCLRQGWRSVQLYDRRNTRTGAFRFEI